MADYKVTDTQLTEIADAIRAKSGASGPLVFPGGFTASVEAISGGGGILDGTAAVVTDPQITALRNYALFYMTGLTGVDFPNVTDVGEHAFENCSALTEVTLPAARKLGISAFFNSGLTSFSGPELVETETYAFGRCYRLAALDAPKLQDVGDHSFYRCDDLAAVALPELLTLGPQGFRKCGALKTADFGKVTALGAESLSATALDTLILRTPTVCTMAAADALLETPIAAGTGYIYVPKVLVEQYRAAANWSTYGARIRAIEDYPTETGG